MQGVDDNLAVICDYAPASVKPLILGNAWVVIGAILTVIAWTGYGICLSRPTDFGQVLNGLLIVFGACCASGLMLLVLCVRIVSQCGIGWLWQRTIFVLTICIAVQFVAFQLADDLFVRF